MWDGGDSGGLDHRMMLEGIAWRYRVGAPWRDLPAEFGPWQTVWKRHRRWSLDGTYAKIFIAVQKKLLRLLPGETDLVEALMSVDSTSIRAHQHAAGGRDDRWTARPSQGAHRITRFRGLSPTITLWAGPAAG